MYEHIKYVCAFVCVRAQNMTSRTSAPVATIPEYDMY